MKSYSRHVVMQLKTAISEREKNPENNKNFIETYLKYLGLHSTSVYQSFLHSVTKVCITTRVNTDCQIGKRSDRE